MGQCGCGDLIPHDLVRIGENVLVVEIYRGCEDCGTGLAVSMYLFTPEAAGEWGFVPDRELKPFAPPLDYPLANKRDLVDAARELNADAEMEQYDSLTGWFQDYGLDLLQRAVRIRLTKEKG